MIPHKLNYCVHALCYDLYVSPCFNLLPCRVDMEGTGAQAAPTAVNKTLPNTEVFHFNVFADRILFFNTGF